MISSGKISHRNRKNPHSREEWQARKKAANATRGKQIARGTVPKSQRPQPRRAKGPLQFSSADTITAFTQVFAPDVQYSRVAR